MLSKSAFNGLLKTLEEPPEHVKFIFATTEARKVPVTVLSRCQRFDLKRIEAAMLGEHLADIAAKEGAEADRDALMLIARAAEGSVRDALSVLDRAIAFGSGRVKTEDLRDLLGLADRGRVYELMETVLKGDAGGALAALASLTADGAEPAQIIADLADAVHAVTIAKAAGASDPAASEAERNRAAELAAKLSMPVLARTWQMLLKGYDEVRASPRPHAAADMVLVRLAYAADLPTPGELARKLRDGSSSGEARNFGQPEGKVAPRRPMPADSAAPSSVELPALAEAQDDIAASMPGTAIADPKSFDEVVSLANDQRELKLRNALTEQVRLVRFRPGHIELNPLPAAPKELGQDLMRKLRAWTGRVWIVVLSGEEGEEPLGVQRRAREAREIEQIREHPQVKEVLSRFPDAQIAAVRSLPREALAEPVQNDEPELKDDGTDP
jgi:DNA polymerase-3 subunit gamma/tau